MVKGSTQKEGVNFNEIFSPIVRLTSIQVVLAMCAKFDLHLDQLNAKIMFIYKEHSKLNLDHCIYYERFKVDDLLSCCYT